ncbi:hypothetical protein DRQ26_04815, partial [bacterium]
MFVDIGKLKDSLEKDLKNSLQVLPKRPKLAVVCTLKDRVADLYLRSQEKFAQKLGIDYECIDCIGCTLEKAQNILQALSRDKETCGIMLCCPLA